MASYVRSLASYLMAQFDARVADQETRERFYKHVLVFSRRQPFTASFLAIQLLFGILPLLGLLGFVLGVVGLALGFLIFWIGLGLCVLFSILTITATVATCVWISGVASLLCFKQILALLSGTTSSSPTKTTQKKKTGETRERSEQKVVPTSKDQTNDQKEIAGRKENGDSPIKIEHTGISDKLYEEDTEGSDDTVGSYGVFNQYPSRAKNEDLKYTGQDAPIPLSETEQMKRDIERSLK